MKNALVFKAGPSAYELIRREGGVDPARIRLMLGASGGPKWLVLARLDRAILRQWLARRQRPLDLLGSSIGTWRFACYAQADPFAAFDRFEETYLAYRYKKGDPPATITADSSANLDRVLGERGAEEILSGPMRLSAVAVRGRLGLLNTERRLPLAAGLAASAVSNLMHRSALGVFFERALFHDARSDVDFTDWRDFPTRKIALTPENLKPLAPFPGCSPQSPISPGRRRVFTATAGFSIIISITRFSGTTGKTSFYTRISFRIPFRAGSTSP